MNFLSRTRVSPSGLTLFLSPFLGLISILALSGCGSVFASRHELAQNIAASHGWQQRIFFSSTFDLTGYVSPARQGSKTLTVYIEGDGLAFENRNTVSRDPTPNDPFTLGLAVQNPVQPTLYLARPCQYTTKRRNCSPAYWTSHRYAPEVVLAMNGAIDSYRQEIGAKEVVLVGYSGGGVVAALLAARRPDVSALITIGANLDHAYWTRMDGLSPLNGSLNPAEEAERLTEIPQWHFVGADDTVVAPPVVRAFAARFPSSQKPTVRVIRGFDHECCWQDIWPRLLGDIAVFSRPSR